MTPEQKNTKLAGETFPVNGSQEAWLWWFQTFYPKSPMIQSIKDNIELLKRIESRHDR